MELKINPVFRDLLRPLNKDEYKSLEQQIISDGCHTPIVIWNNTIVDGHHRYKICKKHGVEFSIKEMDFPSEVEALFWIGKNQNARRNLTPVEIAKLALKGEPALREKAKRNLGGDRRSEEAKSSLPNSANLKPINTRKEIAKIAGMGSSTIYEVKKVEESDNEEAKKKMSTGEWSIHRAYTEVMPKKKETRVCSLCGIEKPLSAFHPDSARCRECNAFTKKHGPGIASTVKRFDGADPDAVLRDMATKNNVTVNTSDTAIITDLLDILKRFRSDVNKYLYRSKEFSDIGNDSELFAELLRTENDIQSIKSFIDGGKQ